RYFWGRDIWRRVGWMPQLPRRWLGAGIAGITPQTWDEVFAAGRRLLPRAMQVPNPGDKLHKLAQVLHAADPDALYTALVTHWPEPDLVRGAEAPVLTHAMPSLTDMRARMMYLDAITYLPDDILVKVDRASMAISLESRVPLLDHSVVEFAWQLPL